MFFTQIVGLTATQVGIGLSVSGVVVFLLAVPMGKVADRVGPKRMWAIGAFLEAATFLCYPLVHGFVAFVAILTALAAVDAGGSAGRGAYTIDAFPRAERVRSMAFMRSALNIGFTLGALLGGLALATGSDDVIRAVPLLTAGVLFLNALLITRLPDAVHEQPAEAPTTATPVEALVTPAALRNRGFVVLGLMNGVLGTNQVLLNVVVPLWLVERTDAPHVLLAWLFGTNTVMAVLLQVPAARGSDTVRGALRAIAAGGRLLRGLLRADHGHARHDRLGLDRADLAGARHDHRARSCSRRRATGASSRSSPTRRGGASTRVSGDSATRWRRSSDRPCSRSSRSAGAWSAGS